MINRARFRFKLPSRTLSLGERTLIMGVLNVTPDSFSDGGEFLKPEKAAEHALGMERSGADIIDIGAESTRPGAASITASEELRRLLPVLERLRGKLSVPISIDTRKAEVAEIALGAGAEIVNDISGLKNAWQIAEVAARHRAPLVLMHIRGEPGTMQKGPFARNVMEDVLQGLHRSIKRAQKAGVRESQIIIDPGIGFGKSYQQNYELLRKLPELAKLEHPLLVGTSRKGFLAATLARNGEPAPVEERIWGTAAAVTASIIGGAHIVRVHDVAEMVQVARVADCVLAAPQALLRK